MKSAADQLSRALMALQSNHDARAREAADRCVGEGGGGAGGPLPRPRAPLNWREVSMILNSIASINCLVEDTGLAGSTWPASGMARGGGSGSSEGSWVTGGEGGLALLMLCRCALDLQDSVEGGGGGAEGQRLSDSEGPSAAPPDLDGQALALVCSALVRNGNGLQPFLGSQDVFAAVDGSLGGKAGSSSGGAGGGARDGGHGGRGEQFVRKGEMVRLMASCSMRLDADLIQPR